MKNSVGFNVFIMFLMLALDLITKLWVRANIPLYQMNRLLENFIDLTHVQNRGVSFSFLSDMHDAIRVPLLVGVSSIAVLIMIIYQIVYWYELEFYVRLGLIFVLPGAIGNLIDRIFFGYVTDFLHFRFYEISFFVNNLADCFISIGAFFLIISTIFYKSKIKN